MTIKLKHFLSLFLCFACVCCLSESYASTMSPPQQTVQNVSDDLLTALKNDKAAIAANPKKELFRIVKKVVLPYIDVDNMVAVVLGRQGHADWVKASESERQAFVDQFITLIVGTYSAALQEYNDQPVKVYPVRGYRSSATRAQVHSQIIRNNGEPINLLYKLSKENTGWKVVDFSVEGISLIQSYQAQFESIVSQKGLKGLVETLKKHNAQNND